jgi:hypothetical protein
MPQWSRDQAANRAKYPDERWRSQAPGAIRPLLLRYDHHVVRILGRRALLLTYHWQAIEQGTVPEGGELLPFEVSFTYAPGHPSAPAEVQAIVDSLSFIPVAISTERGNER